MSTENKLQPLPSNRSLVLAQPQERPRRDLHKDEQGLTPMQRAFVDHFFATGGKRGKAAELAGCGKGNQASTAAHRLMQLPQVQAAIVREGQARLAGIVPQAVRGLDKLVSNAKSEYVKLEAIKDVLNRNDIGTNPVSIGAAVKVEINLD